MIFYIILTLTIIGIIHILTKKPKIPPKDQENYNKGWTEKNILITAQTYMQHNGNIKGEYFITPKQKDNRTLDEITCTPFNKETTNHYQITVWYNPQNTLENQFLKLNQILDTNTPIYTPAQKRNKDINIPYPKLDLHNYK